MTIFLISKHIQLMTIFLITIHIQLMTILLITKHTINDYISDN